MTNILGIDVLDIPDTYTPVGVYALIECLNTEGQPVYVVRHSGMDALRRFGALQHFTTAHAERSTAVGSSHTFGFHGAMQDTRRWSGEPARPVWCSSEERS